LEINTIKSGSWRTKELSKYDFERLEYVELNEF
jgi:hypothetical protein